MQDLKDLFISRIDEFLASDKPAEILDKHLTDAFDSAVRNAFSWGDLNDQVKEVVKAKMGISLDAIDVQSYNAVLADMLNAKMAAFGHEGATQMYADILAKMFKEAPKELDIGELVESLLKELRQEPDDGCVCEGYGEYFHIEWENQYGGYSLKIKDSEQFGDEKVHLYFLDEGRHDSEGEPYWRIAINHAMDISNPTCLHGNDEYLFRLYAARTRIMGLDDFDPGNCDTRKVDADY